MTSRHRALIVLGVALCGVGASASAFAWGSTGHLVTAQIAYDQLSATTKARVDALIRIEPGFAPDIMDFVPAASWMDEMKRFGKGFNMFDPWHYADLPYNPFGLPNAQDAPEQDIRWAVGEVQGILTSDETNEFEKAIALRMLIHFVGDLHQPLHAGTRYSPKFPHGDTGGNAFILDDPSKELHAFWDDTAGLFRRVDPLGDQWKQAIPEFAARIMNDVPKASLPLVDDLGPDDWALESFQLCVDIVYVGIHPNSKPSPAYREKAQHTIERQIALGGYRLAALLEKLFTDKTLP